MYSRRTTLQINLNNIFHNINTIKNLNKGKKVKAIIKANAYGHGAKNIGKILENYNMCDSFGVAAISEGINLRNEGVTLPILVLGDSISFLEAYNYNITLTCYNLEMAKKIKEFNKPLKVHIKIDTGMNRIGLKTIDEFIEVQKLLKNHNIVGVYSHLSSADDSVSYSQMQIEKFKTFLPYIDKSINKDNLEIHIQNTAGCLNFPNLDFVNTIRPGIGVYGINVCEKNFDLKEAISLKCKLTNVKKLPKGEYVGYNRTFVTKEDTYVGTIALGYADGYKRDYKFFGFRDNNKYQVCGRICMDQIMLQITEDLKIGDFIYMVGDKCSVTYIAQQMNLSPYEVLTSFSNRLRREYLYNDEIIAIREEL